MLSCDQRLEIRLPGREKNAAVRAAEERGITISELMRRSLRGHLAMHGPLAEEDAMSVAALRRRINQLEARLNDGDRIGVASDLVKARLVAQALLGR